MAAGPYAERISNLFGMNISGFNSHSPAANIERAAIATERMEEEDQDFHEDILKELIEQRKLLKKIVANTQNGGLADLLNNFLAARGLGGFDIDLDRDRRRRGGGRRGPRGSSRLPPVSTPERTPRGTPGRGTPPTRTGSVPRVTRGVTDTPRPSRVAAAGRAVSGVLGREVTSSIAAIRGYGTNFARAFDRQLNGSLSSVSNMGRVLSTSVTNFTTRFSSGVLKGVSRVLKSTTSGTTSLLRGAGKLLAPLSAALAAVDFKTGFDNAGDILGDNVGFTRSARTGMTFSLDNLIGLPGFEQIPSKITNRLFGMNFSQTMDAYDSFLTNAVASLGGYKGNNLSLDTVGAGIGGLGSVLGDRLNDRSGNTPAAAINRFFDGLTTTTPRDPADERFDTLYGFDDNRFGSGDQKTFDYFEKRRQKHDLETQIGALYNGLRGQNLFEDLKSRVKSAFGIDERTGRFKRATPVETETTRSLFGGGGVTTSTAGYASNEASILVPLSEYANQARKNLPAERPGIRPESYAIDPFSGLQKSIETAASTFASAALAYGVQNSETVAELAKIAENIAKHEDGVMSGIGEAMYGASPDTSARLSAPIASSEAQSEGFTTSPNAPGVANDGGASARGAGVGGVTNAPASDQLNLPNANARPGVGPAGRAGSVSDYTGDESSADRMKGVYDAFRSAGLSHEAAKSFAAEIGRENDYNEGLMFGSHTDPNNQQRNSGMMSWQKDRADNLMAYLGARGHVNPDGTIKKTQAALDAQAAFAVDEMQNGALGNRGKNALAVLQDPNSTHAQRAEVLGRDVIKWDMAGRKINPVPHAAKRDRYYASLGTQTDTTTAATDVAAASPTSAPALGGKEDVMAFWQGRNPRGARLYDDKGNVLVNPELLHATAEGVKTFEAENPNYRVEMYGPAGGVRSRGSTTNHGRQKDGLGGALDIAIIDRKTGQILTNHPGANHQNQGTVGENAPIYQGLYNDVVVAGASMYPGFDKRARFGGYFKGSNPMDLMHFDVRSFAGSAGGSTLGGFTPEQMARYGVRANQGIGSEDILQAEIAARRSAGQTTTAENIPAYRPNLAGPGLGRVFARDQAKPEPIDLTGLGYAALSTPSASTIPSANASIFEAQGRGIAKGMIETQAPRITTPSTKPANAQLNTPIIVPPDAPAASAPTKEAAASKTANGVDTPNPKDIPHTDELAMLLANSNMLA